MNSAGRRSVRLASTAAARASNSLLLRFIGGLELDQQAGGGVGQFFEIGWRAGLIFDRAQRGAVHHFERRCAGLGECADGRAGGVEIGKEQQRGRLQRVIGDGVEHGFGDEGQRAFGADDADG